LNAYLTQNFVGVDVLQAVVNWIFSFTIFFKSALTLIFGFGRRRITGHSRDGHIKAVAVRVTINVLHNIESTHIAIGVAHFAALYARVLRVQFDCERSQMWRETRVCAAFTFETKYFTIITRVQELHLPSTPPNHTSSPLHLSELSLPPQACAKYESFQTRGCEHTALSPTTDARP
jgi:hypothetical protein